jgi:hypothetical protein
MKHFCNCRDINVPLIVTLIVTVNVTLFSPLSEEVLPPWVRKSSRREQATA